MFAKNTSVFNSCFSEAQNESSAITALAQNALSSPSASAPTISKLQFFKYFKRQEEIDRVRMNDTLANVSQLLFGSDEPTTASTLPSIPVTLGGNNNEIKIEEVHSTTTTAMPNTTPAGQKTNSVKPNTAGNSFTRPVFNSSFSRGKSSFSTPVASGKNGLICRQELPQGGTQTQRSRHCGGVEVLQLNCSDCPTTVSSDAQLKTHMQRAHKFYSFRCLHQNCRHSFVSSYYLTQHVQEDHGGQLHCRDCSKKYKTHSGMTKHYAIFHQKGFFQCSRCRLIKEMLKEAIDHWKKCMHRGTSVSKQQPNFVRQAKPSMKLRCHTVSN